MRTFIKEIQAQLKGTFVFLWNFDYTRIREVELSCRNRKPKSLSTSLTANENIFCNLINFFLLRIVRPFFALLGMKLVPPCCLICRAVIQIFHPFRQQITRSRSSCTSFGFCDLEFEINRCSSKQSIMRVQTISHSEVWLKSYIVRA